MYVKIFSQILDSSLADNPKLRHFFMDLLLLSDPDGNLIMTPRAISNRIRMTFSEVEWGLGELQKPDKKSLSLAHEGRRLIPLEGHGYGWHIVNYQLYRDYKTAKEMREATAERVRRWRENRAKKYPVGGTPLPGEAEYVEAVKAGDQVKADKIVSAHLPKKEGLESANTHPFPPDLR